MSRVISTGQTNHWVTIPDPPPRKELRPCCVDKRDKHGRLPIGFCGADCLGRPAVWAAHQKRWGRRS